MKGFKKGLVLIVWLCVMNSASSSEKKETVWVAKSDGAASCAPESGKELAHGADELKKEKIQVLDSRKGSDGKVHIQMCGAPEGTMNFYLIPKKSLPQALALGYQPAPKTQH